MTTIPGVLASAADRWPSNTAIVDGDQSFTFTELRERVDAAAKGMIAAGLGEGDRFAIWAPNCHQWIIAAIAGQSVGGVLVTLNTRFKGGEAADILRRSRCRFLFSTTDFLGTDFPALLGDEQLPALEAIVVMSGPAGSNSAFTDFIQNGAKVTDAQLGDRQAALTDNDIADIIFTSGTTGAPKGAMTTHGQNVAVFETFVDAIGLRQDDRYLIVNPFFHSFGYKAGWLACLIAGAAIYPIATFDTSAIAEMVSHHKITTLPGPPTVFQTLLQLPRTERERFRSLRVATTGAAVIPIDLVRRMKEELFFDDVYTAYGLTESTGVVSLCRKGDNFETIATTCGRAMDGVEVKTVDPNGIETPAGEAGEIWVRGFNVMRGYLDDPVATDEAITSDGWLKTGDIGTLDQNGYLRITDRKKDMFIVGGFNCYPAEIEKLMLGHPEIADVAVVGMPDGRLGEVAHGFVVRSNGSAIDETAVIEWARGAMANYKAPRKITFLDVLPRNASGKVQKFKLPR